VLEEDQENGRSVLRPDYGDQEINDGHYFELMDRALVAFLNSILECADTT
jgi:hypothetical protein